MTNKKNVERNFNCLNLKRLYHDLRCKCIPYWVVILLINLENDEFEGIWFWNDQ